MGNLEHVASTVQQKTESAVALAAVDISSPLSYGAIDSITFKQWLSHLRVGIRYITWSKKTLYSLYICMEAIRYWTAIKKDDRSERTFAVELGSKDAQHVQSTVCSRAATCQKSASSCLIAAHYRHLS